MSTLTPTMQATRLRITAPKATTIARKVSSASADVKGKMPCWHVDVSYSFTWSTALLVPETPISSWITNLIIHNVISGNKIQINWHESCYTDTFTMYVPHMYKGIHNTHVYNYFTDQVLCQLSVCLLSVELLPLVVSHFIVGLKSVPACMQIELNRSIN